MHWSEPLLYFIEGGLSKPIPKCIAFYLYDTAHTSDAEVISTNPIMHCNKPLLYYTMSITCKLSIGMHFPSICILTPSKMPHWNWGLRSGYNEYKSKLRDELKFNVSAFVVNIHDISNSYSRNCLSKHEWKSYLEEPVSGTHLLATSEDSTWYIHRPFPTSTHFSGTVEFT